MRKYIYFLLSVVMLFTCSCERDVLENATQAEVVPGEGQVANAKVINERDTATMAAVDSIKADVGLIKQDVSSNHNTIGRLQQQVQELQKSKTEKYFWILAGLSLLSLILAFVSLVKIKEQYKRLSQLESEVRDLQGLKTIVNSTAPQRSGSHKPEYENFNNRLNKLEEEVRNLHVHDMQRLNSVAKKTERKQTAPTYYFGEVAETDKGYFRKLLGANTDDAMFRAYISGNKAQFEPISWLKIKSNDNALYVVESSGLSPREANQMEVISKGEARLSDGKWIVDQKVKIKLT